MKTFQLFFLLAALLLSSVSHVFEQKTIAGDRKIVAEQNDALRRITEASDHCSAQLDNSSASLRNATRQMQEDVRVMKLCTEFASGR